MKKQSINTFLAIMITLFSLPQAQGSQEVLESAISDAMVRSYDDHRDLKQRVDLEKDQRLESWSEREDVAIEIKHTGAIAGNSNFDLGIDSNLDQEDSGQDNSGLDTLRSEVEEESTDINFDDELREVSLAD